MEAPKLTGLKKRQQIQQANKTMFLWVVAASIAVAICLVLAQFMVRQLMFNNKVISEKNKVQSILDKNMNTFETLKKNVNELVAEENLTALRISDSDTALQVVIDALPTTDDRATLGTSLQQVILARSGVMIESIDVTQGMSTDLAAPITADSKTPSEILFQMTIDGSYDQIAAAIRDVEHSIRPINIEKVQVEGNGKQLRAIIAAKSYYLPGKTMQLTEKTIKP